MLTDLTGSYVYTVSLPDSTWPADTSFGIQLRWDKADAIFSGAYAPFSQYGDLWALEVASGDTIPGVTTTAIFNIDSLKQDTIGLIGVFEDAPSSGAAATYKMKGVYPGIFYNYTSCASIGDKADMGDQGIYTYDQASVSGNFAIKRDPSIGGDQVLPPFNDGTISITDTTLDVLNIKFKDRDSHSSLYSDIPDYVWDEGSHPSVNGVNSGGDRTYMAFPPVLAVSDLGYGDTFIGAYDGSNGTPSAGPAYVYNTDLAPWGNYMTYYGWIFQIEMGYLAAAGLLTDAAGDGSMADDLVGYMLTKLATNPSKTTEYFGVPYGNLVSTTDGTAATATITDDSDHDLGEDLLLGGRMKYTIKHNDCAVPADVTIDFDATFLRCSTDNCTGDNYHITPSWN